MFYVLYCNYHDYYLLVLFMSERFIKLEYIISIVDINIFDTYQIRKIYYYQRYLITKHYSSVADLSHY